MSPTFDQSTILIAVGCLALLMTIPALIVRAIFGRKLAVQEAGWEACRKENDQLRRNSSITPSISRDGNPGMVAQLVMVLGALAGLAGLFATFPPLLKALSEFEKGRQDASIEFTKQKDSLTIFNTLLLGDSDQWRLAKQNAIRTVSKNPKLQIENRPMIITTEEKTLSLSLPAGGVTILVRPGINIQ
jgi:hypothetical protein